MKTATLRITLMLTMLSAVTICVAATPPSSGDLEFVVSPTAIEVSGLTPQAEAIYFGVGRDRNGYANRTSILEGRLVTDASGNARLDFPSGVPIHSVYIVVDQVSRQYSIITPENSRYRQVELPGGSLGPGQAGPLVRLVRQATYMEVVYVRPGVGAWRGSVMDGGPDDESRRPDGHVSLDLSGLRPVSPEMGPAPTHFRGGDLIFGVEPDRLRYLVGRVGQ